jgi:hypothetical protein
MKLSIHVSDTATFHRREAAPRRVLGRDGHLLHSLRDGDKAVERLLGRLRGLDNFDKLHGYTIVDERRW